MKLFDFGLSKRLNPSEEDKLYADLYQLTGQTGSLRYVSIIIEQEDDKAPLLK